LTSRKPQGPLVWCGSAPPRQEVRQGSALESKTVRKIAPHVRPRLRGVVVDLERHAGAAEAEDADGQVSMRLPSRLHSNTAVLRQSIVGWPRQC
jgi:hypothetical protein